MGESDSRKIIRDRLADIAKRNNGRLEPSAVVDDARSEDSPLHELFEWDDSAAAERFREHQARNIIASVRVVIETQERNVRVPAYVHDPLLPNGEQGYASIWQVKRDDDAVTGLLVEEFKRARACLARARNLATALNMAHEIDALINDVDALRQRVSPATVNQ